MSKSPMLEPGDLSTDELRDIVEAVRDILWTVGKVPKEWNADTFDDIVSVYSAYHLVPKTGE